MAVPSGTFPVYMNPRLLAELALVHNALVEERPAVSTFLRMILERGVGPEESWEFQDTQLAVEFLREQGFSVKQFTGKRFLKGLAAEERAQPEEASSSADVRRQTLITKMLEGQTLTAEEQRELEE